MLERFNFPSKITDLDLHSARMKRTQPNWHGNGKTHWVGYLNYGLVLEHVEENKWVIIVAQIKPITDEMDHEQHRRVFKIFVKDRFEQDFLEFADFDGWVSKQTNGQKHRVTGRMRTEKERKLQSLKEEGIWHHNVNVVNLWLGNTSSQTTINTCSQSTRPF